MDASNANDDEIISFPVHKRFLPVVIQALAKAMQQETSVPSSDGSEVTTETEQEDTKQKIDWTQVSNAKKLRKALHIPIAYALLDLAAEREGQLVPFADVVMKAGLASSQQARSSVGALTKVIKREFGLQTGDAFHSWPVEHHWAALGDAQKYYRMSSEVAKAWLLSAGE